LDKTGGESSIMSSDNKGNFHNGSLVFRVFSDGSCELMAKFQYLPDAERYARSRASGDDGTCSVGFIAVCDYSCSAHIYPVVKDADDKDSDAYKARLTVAKSSTR
jgi:hypothetical protein